MESLNNENIFSIIFLFDKSASMSSLGNEPINTLNNFYKIQKESGINFKSTLILFNNNIEFIYENLNKDDIPILTERDYNPSGMTSLLDAIGKTIQYQINKTTSNVIFVILTDGHENSSIQYNSTQIKNLITEMETNYSWQFIYLGANQDAFSVGNNLGINMSVDYDYTPTGLRSIVREISNEISRHIFDRTPISIDRNLSIKSIYSENSILEPETTNFNFSLPPIFTRSISR